MQMRKIYCFRSFALDSAHEKFDVWTGPSYIAPELRNGTAKPSVSSDIYSLAFVLKSFYKILDFKLNGTV